MIDLRNAIIKKEISENENPNKIVRKILDFNKHRKGTGIPSNLATCVKMLTSKKMFLILPIVLAEVKAGNTAENLLNAIRLIICSLYRGKETTKKVCNNIMNSIKL